MVGSAFGPSSAPSTIDIMMITASVTHAIAPSFAIAYGKNGLPWLFRIEYSRRYSSFSRASTAQTSSLRRSFFSALSHGGAVVPSLATRYRCAPISAAIRPGTASMWSA